MRWNGMPRMFFEIPNAPTVSQHPRTSTATHSILSVDFHTGQCVPNRNRVHTDFGTPLASTKAAAPSVILLRRQSNRSVPEVAALIQANIDAIADPIEAGSVVVLEESRIRIRQLPLA